MRWALVALALASRDAPEISRSLGKKDGTIVLWPRALGASSETAARVQAALVTLAPGADVRPEPERVCPREGGCKATALGAVVIEREGGCAVIATISEPGESPARLVPWVGEVELRASSAAFREPPESLVVVKDFAPCAELGARLEEGIGRVRGEM